ncbi:hypothetical protein STCU_10172 [Strigomonas culicis]|uniref:Uncharacterized protein n=1 Tax=Strigomonas culicis TaxID=28005 RepID=S9TN33_9TRYP|nr:hypothetical protein STCU_10172 [Strigomonas culicis]|eukprot:EPY18134.1 hypothetical protein STCU_10172 [Strigomonas culicis]
MDGAPTRVDVRAHPAPGRGKGTPRIRHRLKRPLAALRATPLSRWLLYIVYASTHVLRFVCAQVCVHGAVDDDEVVVAEEDRGAHSRTCDLRATPPQQRRTPFTLARVRRTLRVYATPTWRSLRRLRAGGRCLFVWLWAAVACLIAALVTACLFLALVWLHMREEGHDSFEALVTSRLVGQLQRRYCGAWEEVLTRHYDSASLSLEATEAMQAAGVEGEATNDRPPRRDVAVHKVGVHAHSLLVDNFSIFAHPYLPLSRPADRTGRILQHDYAAFGRGAAAGAENTHRIHRYNTNYYYFNYFVYQTAGTTTAAQHSRVQQVYEKQLQPKLGYYERGYSLPSVKGYRAQLLVAVLELVNALHPLRDSVFCSRFLLIDAFQPEKVNVRGAAVDRQRQQRNWRAYEKEYLRWQQVTDPSVIYQNRVAPLAPLLLCHAYMATVTAGPGARAAGAAAPPRAFAFADFYGNDTTDSADYFVQDIGANTESADGLRASVCEPSQRHPNLLYWWQRPAPPRAAPTDPQKERYLLVMGIPSVDNRERHEFRLSQRKSWMQYRDVATRRKYHRYDDAAAASSASPPPASIFRGRMLPLYAVNAHYNMDDIAAGAGHVVGGGADLTRLRLVPSPPRSSAAAAPQPSRRASLLGVNYTATAPLYISSVLVREALYFQDLLWLHDVTDAPPATGKKTGEAGWWGLRTEVTMTTKVLLLLFFMDYHFHFNAHAWSAAPTRADAGFANYVPFFAKGDDDIFIKVPQLLYDLSVLRQRATDLLTAPAEPEGERRRHETDEVQPPRPPLLQPPPRIYWGIMKTWEQRVFFASGMLYVLSQPLLATVLQTAHLDAAAVTVPLLNHHLLRQHRLALEPFTIHRVHSYVLECVHHEDIWVGQLVYYSEAATQKRVWQSHFAAATNQSARRALQAQAAQETVVFKMERAACGRFHDIHRGRNMNEAHYRFSTVVHHVRPEDNRALLAFFSGYTASRHETRAAGPTATAWWWRQEDPIDTTRYLRPPAFATPALPAAATAAAAPVLAYRLRGKAPAAAAAEKTRAAFHQFWDLAMRTPFLFAHVSGPNRTAAAPVAWWDMTPVFNTSNFHMDVEERQILPVRFAAACHIRTQGGRVRLDDFHFFYPVVETLAANVTGL